MPKQPSSPNTIPELQEFIAERKRKLNFMYKEAYRDGTNVVWGLKYDADKLQDEIENRLRPKLRKLIKKKALESQTKLEFI
jgi:hypothetical protein